jgi:hypothetical protein
MLHGKKPPDAIDAMQTVCTTAASSQEVQGTPLAAQCCATLTADVAKADTSLTTYNNAKQAFRVATKAFRKDLRQARSSLGFFMGIVNGIAKGEAKIITAAGLIADDGDGGAPGLEKVTKLESHPWKKEATAKLSWPAAGGATSYAVEVNPTPQNPTGPYTPLGTATRRTRILAGAAPGAQLLARVAAVASDGTMSEWSSPILVIVSS